MLASITQEQFDEWSEYYKLEPFGEERADLRMGVLGSLYANAHYKRAGGGKFQPADFALDFEGEPQKPRTWQEIKSEFDLFFRPQQEIAPNGSEDIDNKTDASIGAA